MFEKVCRLCLKRVCDNFHTIGSSLRDILNNLLLKLNLDISKNIIICIECVQKLQIFSNFKSICIHTKNKMCLLGSRDQVYAKLNRIQDTNTEPIDTSRNQMICCFCTNSTEEGNLMLLNDLKEYVNILDMLQKHMPELNLNDNDEIVTCKSCLELLQGLTTFIRNCLCMEENIKKYIELEGTNDNDQVELQLNNVQQLCTVKSILKHDVGSNDINLMEIGCNEEEETFFMITEADAGNEEDMDGLELNIEHVETGINSDDCESFHTSLFLPESHENSSETSMYQCNFSPFNTDFKRNLKKHIPHNSTTVPCHSSEIIMYQCEFCSFNTEYKDRYEEHITVIHKNSPETPVHTCEKCTYETKDMVRLKEHMKVHKNEIYSCELCPFTTKYKDSYERHKLTHRDPSETPLFICDKCYFKTNIKKDLQRHMIAHKDESEITLYKCASCSFQTKHKNNLRSHNMRSHKDASEITMYECESCSFTTKYKRNMERHKMSHNKKNFECDTMKITIYKCDFCAYETTHKHYLKTHLLKHKLPSESIVHQCDVCSYKTTRGKERLRQHMIVHKDATEVTLYYCDLCSFKSKYKNSYERHLLTHKNPSETPMYRCIKFDSCSFQTKHKNNLKAHNMRFHKEAL